jgi:hypothetical protein
MSSESNLKLKVKVDSTELDKLSTKMKGIEKTTQGSGNSSLDKVEESQNKVKNSTEELIKTQKFAAEISKILSDEQAQLATSFDFAEVSQKALGAALKEFGGLSTASVGVLMGVAAAIGVVAAAAYEYYGQINQQEIALKSAGIALDGYAGNLHEVISAQEALSLSARNTSLGLSTTTTDLQQYGQTLIVLKSRFGNEGEGILNRALEGDAAAMRMLGIMVSDTSTKIERQIEVRRRLAETQAIENREQNGLMGSITRWIEDSAHFFGLTVSSIDRIKIRNQEALELAQRLNAEQRERELAEERIQRSRTNVENQIGFFDRLRMERSIEIAAVIEKTDEELAFERRRNEALYQQMQDTTGLRGEALQKRLNELREVGAKIQNIDLELARRNNTAAGIRARLYDEALQRAIAAGRNINQLESIQISNGRIRVELEAKIAELRRRLVGLTGQDAAAIRTQIAGIISQIQSLNGANVSSKPAIALKEIRDMIQQIRRIVEETTQNDFIRSIQNGTITIEEQMRRLNDLQNQRIAAEQRNREAILRASSLAEQLENARTNRERQRLAAQQRTLNEEVSRTQEALRFITTEYENASQAISRNISEREAKFEQERINAEKLAYDSRNRILQNQIRTNQDELAMNRNIFDAWIADQQGSATDYQRFLANLFNPEQMIAQIRFGVQQAGEVVSQEAARLAQMQQNGAAPEELANQTQRVVEAQRAQTQAIRESEQALMDLHQRMREASPGAAFVKSLTNGTKGISEIGSYAGNIGAKGLNLFADAIWGSLDAIKSGEDIGASLMKMLSATLQSIGQEATVKALMETAAGIAATVTPGLQATAPAHFTAAGIYAGVAAAAGIGYLALPSPPSKDSKEKESLTTDRELLNAQRKEQNIVINGSAFMTKEELSKAARKIADYSKDL